jgi:hypothetical protein
MEGTVYNNQRVSFNPTITPRIEHMILLLQVELLFLGRIHCSRKDRKYICEINISSTNICPWRQFKGLFGFFYV